MPRQNAVNIKYADINKGVFLLLKRLYHFGGNSSYRTFCSEPLKKKRQLCCANAPSARQSSSISKFIVHLLLKIFLFSVHLIHDKPGVVLSPLLPVFSTFSLCGSRLCITLWKTWNGRFMESFVFNLLVYLSNTFCLKFSLSNAFKRRDKIKKNPENQWRFTNHRACGSRVGLAFIRPIGKRKACKALNIKDILINS